MRKISLAAVLLYSLVALASAFAHGAVERTIPADDSEVATTPEKVQVWFNEALQTDTGAIQVITSAGERVEQGDVRHSREDATLLEIDLKPDLPAGAYIISASGIVVSDGHTATGSALFWIGTKNTSPPPDYEILGVTVGVLIGLGIVGYWLLTRPSGLIMTPTTASENHFPLE